MESCTQPTSCVFFLCQSPDEEGDDENHHHTNEPENHQHHHYCHPQMAISCKMTPHQHMSCKIWYMFYLITRTRKHDHITPVLKELHWLPVESRIVFNMLVMTFKCISCLAPSYLAELVQPRECDGRLRQNYAPTLHQGITKKCIGDSAFGAAAPRLWNELPVNILASGTLPMFRKCLKTYLFTNLHFN